MRARRTKIEKSALAASIESILQEEPESTVRQVYYRLVSLGILPKTSQAYRVIVRMLTESRRNGSTDHDRVVDHTRRVIVPASWDGLAGLLESARAAYRRSMWSTQPLLVDVWLEKDTLSGIVCSVTGPALVPLHICRGFPSETFVHAACQKIRRRSRPTRILYIGDHDPSGSSIEDAIHSGLGRYAPRADCTVERIAVTERQIRELKLVTRPTTMSDPRAHAFEGESVEVEAIPAKVLRVIIDDEISKHVDYLEWRRMLEQEKSDRQKLAEWMRSVT